MNQKSGGLSLLGAILTRWVCVKGRCQKLGHWRKRALRAIGLALKTGDLTMNRFLRTALIAVALFTTACQPTKNNTPANEKEQPRETLSGTPQPGPELTAAQVEDLRTLIKNQAVANVASLLLVELDERPDARVRREKRINNASPALAAALNLVRRDCQILQPKKETSGDLSAPGRTSADSTKASISGERCPILASTEASRVANNESINDTTTGGRLYVNNATSMSYEVKDAKMARDLGLTAEKLSMSFKGPLVFAADRFRGDLHGTAQGLIQIPEAPAIEWTARVDYLMSGSARGGTNPESGEVEIHFQIPYKKVDYRLSIFEKQTGPTKTRKVFLNGKELPLDGFEDFATAL